MKTDRSISYCTCRFQFFPLIIYVKQFLNKGKTCAELHEELWDLEVKRGYPKVLEETPGECSLFLIICNPLTTVHGACIFLVRFIFIHIKGMKENEK
jgi:hypothetical protein